MGVANSFAPVLGNRFTRKWAGTSTDAVDGYVSGFFHTHFAYLPPKLAENVMLAGGNDGLSTNQDIQRVLHGSCIGVTIPGATLNKAEFTGLGGIKWGMPTNLDYDNTLTMKFIEFSTLPIFAIIHGWVRMIRDYRAGVTNLVGEEGTYTKSNYTASLYYWTTKPDGKTVEYYACANGMFPTKDPTDQFGGDTGSYDKLEMDIDFHIDTLWHESWVKERCQSLADTVYNDRNVMHEYGKTPAP